jgi:hypothetical protein
MSGEVVDGEMVNGFGLLGYADHQLSLGKRQKDGSSLRDNLESVYRQTGKMPDQLKQVEVNEAILYIWQWFCQLSSKRQSGMNGPLPTTFTEMKAWSEMTGIVPDPWEVSVLEQLDQLYLQSASKKS